MSKELNKALDLLREIRPSIPKDVLELWCKDRDAFLASHKATVEQAGGDEGAAFEQWEAEQISFVLRQIGSMDTGDIDGDDVDLRFEDADGRDTGCDVSIVEYADKAANLIEAMLAERAALAQPSPPPHPSSELDFSRPLATENGEPVKWICADVIEYKSARVCVAKDTGLVYSSPYIGLKIRNVIPEQAEAERPEVVGVRYEDGTILSAEDCGTALEVCAKVQTPLMTVAQHERIVGELRAVIAQLRQHKNDYMDSGQETYRALQNEIREREAEIARLDGLVSGRTAERDAALAEVERLRQFERICEGLPQDAIDGGWTVQGIRRYAKRLEDQLKVALARVAELEKQEPVGEVRESGGALTAVIVRHSYATKLPVGTKLYAAPVAQAQHSVPDGVTIERDVAGTIHIKVGDFDFIQLQYQRPHTDNASTWKLAERIASLLAAAPGKEGV
ncbi:hypothetical protein ACM7TJ_29875 [Pseudomonas aeruginosa]